LFVQWLVVGTGLDDLREIAADMQRSQVDCSRP
jgi:hypothetical protein